jgi:hypothetical protein
MRRVTGSPSFWLFCQTRRRRLSHACSPLGRLLCSSSPASSSSPHLHSQMTVMLSRKLWSAAFGCDSRVPVSNARSFLVEQVVNHKFWSPSFAYCQHLCTPSHLTAAAPVHRNMNVAHHDCLPTYCEIISEIRCCNKAAHIRRHRATDKKTKTSNSEVVTALLIQDIQKYPLARRVPQLIETFRRNVKSPFIV